MDSPRVNEPEDSDVPTDGTLLLVLLQQYTVLVTFYKV